MSVGSENKRNSIRPSPIALAATLGESRDGCDVEGRFRISTVTAPPELPARLAYSISDLSALTSLSRSLIYEHVQSGLLRVIKVGRRTIVTQKDAELWLETLRMENTNPTRRKEHSFKSRAKAEPILGNAENSGTERCSNVNADGSLHTRRIRR